MDWDRPGAVTTLALQGPPVQTVFHVSSPDPGDQRHATTNVPNLLDDETVSAPGDDVVLVANGAGVRMFVAGESDLEHVVDRLPEREVALGASGTALASLGAADADLLPVVEGVSSGSGELARLQAQGFGYVKAP